MSPIQIFVRSGPNTTHIVDVVDIADGLAITEALFGGGYAVTHVRSGACFGNPNRPTVEECRALREKLLALPFDWHMSESYTEVVSITRAVGLLPRMKRILKEHEVRE